MHTSYFQLLVLIYNNLTFYSLFSKGISQSALPYRRSVPTWLKLTPDDCKDLIYKLAKKGHTPSQIGKTQIIYYYLTYIQ